MGQWDGGGLCFSFLFLFLFFCFGGCDLMVDSAVSGCGFRIQSFSLKHNLKVEVSLSIM